MQIKFVPYSQNFIKLFRYSLLGLIFGSSISIFRFQSEIDFAIVIFLIILLIASFITFYIFNYHFILISNKQYNNSIENITDNGFEFTKEGKKQVYYWSDFQSINLNDTQNGLIITFKDNKRLLISNETDNWYLLVKNIPANFKEFDFEAIRILFANLKSCKVCGFKADNGTECLSCGTQAWSNDLTNFFPNKLEFHKKEQLFLLSNLKLGKDLKIPENPNFEKDPNWVPLVDLEEVNKFDLTSYYFLKKKIAKINSK